MIRTLKDRIDETLTGSHDRLRVVTGSLADVAAFSMMAATESKMKMVRRHNGPALVSCPGCGVHVEMDMLVDVSGADAELTKGAKWACTGCLDLWYREGRTVSGKIVSRGDIHLAIGGDTFDDNHPYWTSPAFRS